MARRPRPAKISYSLKIAETGDVPKAAGLARASGIEFYVAPPSAPSLDFLIDDTGTSAFFDDAYASGSGIQFNDDLLRVTAPG